MNFDPAKSYWYTFNHERRGPVTGAELQQMVRASQIASTELVWCEGMSAWQTAGAVPGLFGPASAPPAMPGGTFSTLATAPAHAGSLTEVFPMAPLKGANAGLFLGLFIGSWLLFLVAGGLIAAIEESGAESLRAASGLAVLPGFATLVTSVVLGCIYLYRGWAAIQGYPRASSTPGKAVGFLFIPLFNIYWFFVAFGNWARDYNAFVRAREFTDAPKMSEGLFLAFAILTVSGLVPFINLLTLLPRMIIGLICIARVCTAVNYLRAESERMRGA